MSIYLLFLVSSINQAQALFIVPPTFQQLQILLTKSELATAKSKYNRYDRDSNNVLSTSEILRKFEYLSKEDLSEYWNNCDTNADQTLSFAEWLRCSGMYSDNGELYDQTEWDAIVNDGLLRFNAYQTVELTDLAWQAYNERQPVELSPEELERKAKEFKQSETEGKEL